MQKTLIDLHCHILPGIDDGSRDMNMSLRLASDAVKQGITHALVTPHHMDSEYENHKQDVIRETKEFQDELVKNNIPLTVFPSQEVHLTGELLDAIDNDDILYMDDLGRYILLELPHSGVPAYTDQVIFDLQARGITPVIAHPERNQGFQKDPDKLYEFVDNGCLTQLTSSSYMGVFGPRVEEFTKKIIKANLGVVFSSDAHNFEGRRFLMKEAFEKLELEYDEITANRFAENAKKILNGESVLKPDIHHLKTEKERKKRFWLF